MAEVTKVETQELVVRYTIKHEKETLTYDIPRSFTREDADATLLSYLKTLENPQPQVETQTEDWSSDAKVVSVKELEARVKADTEAREKVQAEADAIAKKEREAQEAELERQRLEETGQLVEQPSDEVDTPVEEEK